MFFKFINNYINNNEYNNIYYINNIIKYVRPMFPRWLGMTNMHIPSHEHGCIFIVIFFKKTKEAPNSKIKISIMHTAA